MNEVGVTLPMKYLRCASPAEPEIMVKLLTHELINHADFEGKTVMWLSCYFHAVPTEVIKVIIDYGADINHRDYKGETPISKLHFSKKAKHDEKASLMISSGAKVDSIKF